MGKLWQVISINGFQILPQDYLVCYMISGDAITRIGHGELFLNESSP